MKIFLSKNTRDKHMCAICGKPVDEILAFDEVDGIYSYWICEKCIKKAFGIL